MEPETDLQQLVIHDFPEDQALRRRSENKRQTSAGPKNPGENLDYAKRNMEIIKQIKEKKQKEQEQLEKNRRKEQEEREKLKQLILEEAARVREQRRKKEEEEPVEMSPVVFEKKVSVKSRANMVDENAEEANRLSAKHSISSQRFIIPYKVAMEVKDSINLQHFFPNSLYHNRFVIESACKIQRILNNFMNLLGFSKNDSSNLYMNSVLKTNLIKSS